MLTNDKSWAIPEHVFMEYDIRGKAGTDLDARFAYLLGYAFADRLWQLGYKVAVVGHDNRESSPELHDALIAGITQAACSVIDLGEVTTPMFYFGLHHYHVPCGVMVTASHNPGDENGFKMAVGGTTIYGSQIQELRKSMHRIYNAQNISAQLVGHWERVRQEDVWPAYLDMLKEKIQLASRPLKVVVDCGNGTDSAFAPEALEAWGCEVVPLYCESDPTFPNHHPDPAVPENLRDLIALVQKDKADLGIAVDGDGDRLGVVDNQGNILWGDQLMILFWREILPKHPGARAPIEVKCSQALVEDVERMGGHPFFHRTGHSHIKATLREEPMIPFAGEMSGHLFFNDEYYGYDDALYAAGRLLRILSRTDKPLSDLLADVPKYDSTPEIRVPCADEDKARVLAGVKSYFDGKYPVIDVDGSRILFNEGWGLVRSSNTQPILVMRAEGKSHDSLLGIKREMEQALTSIQPDIKIPW